MTGAQVESLISRQRRSYAYVSVWATMVSEETDAVSLRQQMETLPVACCACPIHCISFQMSSRVEDFRVGAPAFATDHFAPNLSKKKGTCSTRSLFASCPRQALHACITASSSQGLGTMAHVGLFDMSASIAGVIPRHFSYVDPASAIPPLNAEASAARALAAYPPDHAG
ncbi:MAG: hypothetical protein ACD_23C00053G0002 [uncultured bacterium]|nr:MAG: hypothetical protein ACD_23C00053G0002 [uncultured bacterium]